MIFETYPDSRMTKWKQSTIKKREFKNVDHAIKHLTICFITHVQLEYTFHTCKIDHHINFAIWWLVVSIGGGGGDYEISFNYLFPFSICIQTFKLGLKSIRDKLADQRIKSYFYNVFFKLYVMSVSPLINYNICIYLGRTLTIYLIN